MSVTQQQVLGLLDYDPHTGIFRWRYQHDAQSRGERIRNARTAGKVAGFRHSTGIRIKIDGVHFNAHRLAFLWMTGSTPRWVRPRNGDLYDNRWNNLRGPA